jgi:hypothetical protein
MGDHQYGSGEESGSFDPENLTENSSTGQSSQYAKDLQRVHGALNSGATAFRKGRLGGKVGLTVENLSRRNGSNDSLGSPLGGGGSGSSKGSDPSINVPREWGRKARPGKDWLNRINSKSGRYTGDISKRHRRNHTIPEQLDEVEPLHEWVNTAAPETPDSHHAGPQHRSLSSPESTPTTSMQNLSRERVADWDINDADFTGRSLQASESPPIRVRTNTLDRGLDREIDNLAKRAVTTNRLDQLGERTPEERFKRRLQSRSAENLSDPTDHHARQTPQHRRSSLKFPHRPDIGGTSERFGNPIAALGDDGDPIPDSPVVIYRGTSGSSKKGTGVDHSTPGTHTNSAPRPAHGRQDSRDLLRQLARATSESPPARKDENPAGVSNDTDAKPLTQSDENPKEARKAMDPQKRRENDKKDVGSLGAPKSAETGQVVQPTPQPSKSKLDMKTPLVTGAWIDTPLPTGGRGLPLPTPANLDDERDIRVELGGESRKVAATELIRTMNPNILSKRPKRESREALEGTGPVVPKSALESIISAAKSRSKSRNARRSNRVSADSDEDPTLLLGESTIQSLEEILDDDDTNTPKLCPPSQPSSTVQSDEERSIEEDLADPQPPSLSGLQSQLSRLDHVGPSIRDAKRRLAFLERALAKAKSRSGTPTECDEGGEIHDFVWPCEKCGHPSRREFPFATSTTDGLATISITIPKLWRWRENDWRPRLTWLGVGVLVWWGYLIADRIAW